MSKLTIIHSRKPLDCKIFQLPQRLKVFLLAQLVHSKTCRAMSQESENVSDRELFSELFANPIHPLLVNIVSHRTKRRSSSEIERSLWATQQSVCNSAIKHSASRLPISGLCSGACWECVGREYQEILAKDTGQ